MTSSWWVWVACAVCACGGVKETPDAATGDPADAATAVPDAAAAVPDATPPVPDADTSVVDAAPVDAIACTDECDPLQGLSCDSETGLCAGACAPSSLTAGNLGCDFFPTVTATLVNPDWSFAVVVSNASAADADVTIQGGALTAPMTLSVPAGRVAVQTLPWVPELKLCNTSGSVECTDSPSFDPSVVPGGAYRLRSTQPVAVYQFNPLDYTDGAGAFSYTNDGSLLLPAHSLGTDYVVASYPAWPAPTSVMFPGLIAVTAVEDGTTVNVTPTVAMAGGGLDFPAGTPTALTMNRGDVLQLLNQSGDLTGSSVSSDLPVQVIAGHYCTQVPNGVLACDHLEESQLPVSSLGTSYVATAPAVPSIPTGKVRVIRIVATEAATTVAYNPPIAGAGTTLASPGDFIEVADLATDHVITADKKVAVSQLMEGQAAGGATGDPSLTSAVPTAQYRSEYQFQAPTNYELNYVNVTAPAAATISLDGSVVTGFTPVGTSGYKAARVALSAGPSGDGSHAITGDMPFGITVYGYGQYTSYWYPGGLELGALP